MLAPWMHRTFSTGSSCNARTSNAASVSFFLVFVRQMGAPIESQHFHQRTITDYQMAGRGGGGGREGVGGGEKFLRAFIKLT